MAPAIVYLLGDGAKDINGQVFQATGYELRHLGRPRWDTAMTNPHLWDLDAVAARLHDELGPELQLPYVPWPEKKE
jgi:hypothetical protein